MESFRYDQFCPVARAAEIVGHRWVFPILRELTIGPQRFTDLRRRLPGLGSSMLADRLAGLESQGIVVRRQLARPAPAIVYDLTADGEALGPTMLELARWGLRFLTDVKPGDHVEADWVELAVRAFAGKDATPLRRFELRPQANGDEAVIRIAGGPDGTYRLDDDQPVDLTITAPVVAVLRLMSGAMAPADALKNDAVLVEGDSDALSDLAGLFKMSL